MELTSITQIRELKDSLKEQIATVDKSRYSDLLYGSESEYTFRGLLAGLDCLLTDVTSLTKAPNQFLKLSTYQERQQILNALKNCESYINSPQYLWTYLDNLKIALRPFHIRYTKERLLDFDEELSSIVRKKQVLDEELVNIKELKQKNEVLLNDLTTNNEKLEEVLNECENKLKEADEKNEELNEKFDELKNKISESDSLIDKATEIVATSDVLLTETQNNAELIKEFESTVDKRENQIKVIDARTIEYRTNIEKFEKERIELNDQAQDTIAKALIALEYNTARGLSASFQTQLDKIENSKYYLWLVGASFFLLLTVGIGIWIVLTGHLDIYGTIGRLSLTPFTITGAIFCANQYIRQKNVIEDYSYKLVLSKSIVGFSEQLNNGRENSNEYKEYIKIALSEIHKDPLRKRSKIDKDVDGGIKNGIDTIIETAQKIIGITNRN